MTQDERDRKISDLVVQIEGHYPFAIFEGRWFTTEGEKIGVKFDMFGDKWKIGIFPGETKFTLEHIDPDGYVGHGRLPEEPLLKYIWQRYFSDSKVMVV